MPDGGMAHSGGDSPPRIQRDYRLEMQAKSKRFQSLEVYENLLLTDLSYDKWENKSPGWKEMTQDGCANPQNKEPGAAGTALKEKTEEAGCPRPTSKLVRGHGNAERVRAGTELGTPVKEPRAQNSPLGLWSTDFQQKHQDDSREKKVFSTSVGTNGCCNNAPNKHHPMFKIQLEMHWSAP